MPDAIFDHPRLALLYDVFDDDRSDLTHYVTLLDELGARSVLDVGCGTGSLAVLLASRGVSVTGLDPAGASLAVARQKTYAQKVRWLHGDATSLPAMQVDAAIMTGNVAQVFLDDESWVATLRGIHASLHSGGSLIFETRRPERRVWEDWGRSFQPAVKDVPGVGHVEQRYELTDVDLPYVSFRFTYTFMSNGERIVSESTLRFRSRAEIEDSLVSVGFSVDDVREAPDRPGKEYVFVAQARR